MLSTTIEFQRSLFQTEEKVKIQLKNREDIIPFLKKLFYFENEEELRTLLESENKSRRRTCYISVRSSTKTPISDAIGPEKPIVSEIFRELWDREEDNGYWLVLVFRYKH